MMRFYTFQIVVEKEPEDAGYYAYSPTLPGCFSNGKSSHMDIIDERKIHRAIVADANISLELGHIKNSDLNYVADP